MKPGLVGEHCLPCETRVLSTKEGTLKHPLRHAAEGYMLQNTFCCAKIYPHGKPDDYGVTFMQQALCRVWCGEDLLNSPEPSTEFQ